MDESDITREIDRQLSCSRFERGGGTVLDDSLSAPQQIGQRVDYVGAAHSTSVPRSEMRKRSG